MGLRIWRPTKFYQITLVLIVTLVVVLCCVSWCSRWETN